MKINSRNRCDKRIFSCFRSKTYVWYWFVKSIFMISITIFRFSVNRLNLIINYIQIRIYQWQIENFVLMFYALSQRAKWCYYWNASSYRFRIWRISVCNHIIQKTHNRLSQRDLNDKCFAAYFRLFRNRLKSSNIWFHWTCFENIFILFQ